ncbi:hypothetical protein DITRI_Ditri07aG0068600 [Diplodiscus trichospermus]
MDAFFFYSPSPFSIISVLFLLIFSQLSYSHDDIHFTSCPPFDCGNLHNLSYPFRTDDIDRPAYCGHDNEAYKLKCFQNQPPVMTISFQEFQLLHLNKSHGLITIRRMELGENTCPWQILVNNVFNYSDTAKSVTLLYDCGSRGITNHSFICEKDGSERFGVLSENNGNECGGEKVEIPVGNKAFDELMSGITLLNETLARPFDMKYFAYDGYCKQYKHSGGRCGSNKDMPLVFACYCRDQPQQFKCQSKSGFWYRIPGSPYLTGVLFVTEMFISSSSRNFMSDRICESNLLHLNNFHVLVSA